MTSRHEVVYQSKTPVGDMESTDSGIDIENTQTAHNMGRRRSSLRDLVDSVRGRGPARSQTTRTTTTNSGRRRQRRSLSPSTTSSVSLSDPLEKQLHDIVADFVSDSEDEASFISEVVGILEDFTARAQYETTSSSTRSPRTNSPRNRHLPLSRSNSLSGSEASWTSSSSGYLSIDSHQALLEETLRRVVLKRDGYKCWSCGSTKWLEAVRLVDPEDDLHGACFANFDSAENHIGLCTSCESQLGRTWTFVPSHLDNIPAKPSAIEYTRHALYPPYSRLPGPRIWTGSPVAVLLNAARCILKDPAHPLYLPCTTMLGMNHGPVPQADTIELAERHGVTHTHPSTVPHTSSTTFTGRYPGPVPAADTFDLLKPKFRERGGQTVELRERVVQSESDGGECVWGPTSSSLDKMRFVQKTGVLPVV